jgi:pimeloyl-ACP methyl ester carboxylesterase
MAKMALSMAPSKQEADACRWLVRAELEYYATEFQRTGLQGGLNWYRCSKSAKEQSALAAFAGQEIQAPLAFVGGAQDWGVRQAPGALEAMETRASVDFRGTHLIENAGHWVQQEQPEAVLEVVGAMLKS